MLNIKAVRTQRAHTQAEVAEFLNIARSTYTNIENGRSDPDTETLLKLAEYFGCSVDTLLGKDDIENSKKEPASDRSGLTPEGVRIAEKIDRLSADSRRELEKYVDFLVSQARRDT